MISEEDPVRVAEDLPAHQAPRQQGKEDEAVVKFSSAERAWLWDETYSRNERKVDCRRVIAALDVTVAQSRRVP